MTTEEWLMQTRCLSAEITALKDIYQQAIEQAISIGNAPVGDKVQYTHMNSSENKMVKVSEYALRIKRTIEQKERIQSEILYVIEQVKSTRERTLLTYYYIAGLTLEETAERMNVSVRGIHNIKRRAVAEIKKIRGN